MKRQPLREVRVEKKAIEFLKIQYVLSLDAGK